MSTGAASASQPRRLLAVALAVALALSAASCSSDDDPRIPLDGTARHPDVAGVVEQVSTTRISVRGGRTFRIDRGLQSFASQTMQAVPILQRKGQYVHIGADGDRAVWVAAVGSVIPGDRPTVYYPGTVRRVDGREVVFADGTVLTLARGVEAPRQGAKVVAEIDPSTNQVRAIPLA